MYRLYNATTMLQLSTNVGMMLDCAESDQYERKHRTFSDESKVLSSPGRKTLVESYPWISRLPKRETRVSFVKSFRKRGLQRWTVLLTATKSRIGFHNGMRAFLVPALWEDFVSYATSQWKTALLDRFTKPMHGSRCPFDYAVNPADRDHLKLMSGLHLDHCYELTMICDVCKQALGPSPTTWYANVNRDFLCHLLFGLQDDSSYGWRANLIFRCGRPKGTIAGDKVDYCHNTKRAHYDSASFAVTVHILAGFAQRSPSRQNVVNR